MPLQRTEKKGFKVLNQPAIRISEFEEYDGETRDYIITFSKWSTGTKMRQDRPDWEPQWYSVMVFDKDRQGPIAEINTSEDKTYHKELRRRYVDLNRQRRAQDS